MSRLQLALNVPDLDEAVDFYARLFATGPAKRRPGYANFAIEDPPLKLVLFEAAGSESRLNHLGVEVADPAAVREHQARLEGDGIEASEGSGTCCYAAQEKVWIDAPDGPWELYSVLADSPTFGEGATTPTPGAGGSVCCASASASATPPRT